MRILHVTADWKWTGPAEPMLHAVTGLRERGHRVDLACARTPEGSGPALWERAQERGVKPVLELERGQGYRPWRDRAAVRALRARIEREAYDLVHVHHSRDHLLCRSALGRAGARRALVASWHHGDPVRPWPWQRWLLGPRGLAGLTALSERLVRRAERDLGWPVARLAVLPGVVDTIRFAPRERRAEIGKELGLAPPLRAVGVVARLQPHRRFDLLLEAFARAQREAPELRLVVIGRGTRAAQVLEEPVKRMGLGESVIRAGYRREDYLDVLAWLDALAFLVPGSDGSCRAVLEAMAMGLPVIASQRGVLPECVGTGESGRVVPEEPAALAGALCDVARSPERWRTYGAAARERMCAQHTLDLHAQRLERFYARLAGC